MQSRSEVQKLRKVPDSVILSYFGSHIEFAQTTNPQIALVLEKIAKPIVFLMGAIIRLIVFW